jgi:type I restriction enzyme S subunit
VNYEYLSDNFDAIFESPDAVDRLRDLILHMALCGYLSKPDPADISVRDFLKTIWNDRSSGRSEQNIQARQYPVKIPNHWEWRTLSELATYSIGRTPPRGDSSFWNDGHTNWVSIADMTQYGTITSTKETVSELAANKIFRQRIVPIGSILMSFKLTIGKVSWAGIPCFHNEAIISMRPPESDLRNYLFRFLPYFAKLQTSNNAIKGKTLNSAQISAIPIAVPPPSEQRAIVEKVDALLALCFKCEEQYGRLRKLNSALLDSYAYELSGGAISESLHSISQQQIDNANDTPISTEIPEIRSDPPTDSSELSQRLIALLHQRNGVSSGEAQAVTGASAESIRSGFRDLVTRNIVRTEGERRGMRYFIK